MDSESIETVTVSKSSLSSPEKLFPPGFRFHPTDEELVLYYLKRKICGRSLKLDIIGEVDVYKWDPEELPGQSKWKTGDRQWFFFCPRDRKYPNGGRSNRATMHGYWKVTGKDRIIKYNSRVAGIKKTLVYYQGRAPSGQRTDWVMHEYTLDEEELKRCRDAQECYALYKVFKKSGPGPKNGEQYGAPFVEEWANDDYLDVDELLVQNIDTLVNEPKFTSGITVEPEFAPTLAQINLVEPEIAPTPAHINLVNGEEESQNNLLVCSVSKVDYADKRMAMGPSLKLLDVQPVSDLAESANEPSRVTSVEELQPLVVDEDFLEMDDLTNQQSAFQNSQPLVLDNLQVADFDGLYEFDLYSDMTGFNEMNPFEIQQIQQPYYTSNLDYGMENSDFHSYSNCAGSETINIEHQTGYDLWTHDQSNNSFAAAQASDDFTAARASDDFTAARATDDFTDAQATDVAIFAPSGVVTGENPGKPDSGVNQCRETGEDDGTDSWFSSALWAFVESVPSTPASALESSALVNKAFERMSSFSRIGNANKADGVECTLTTRRFERSSRSSRGIIYFSVLVVLFAILYVCVGTSIKLLGRCIL